MTLNWGIESYKWYLTAKFVEPISFKKAIACIFAGTTISSFMPNRIGEYAGRVLFLKDDNKARGSILALYLSLFQISATLLIGIPASLYFNSKWLFVNQTYLIAAIIAYSILLVGSFILANSNFRTFSQSQFYIRLQNLIGTILKLPIKLSVQLTALSLVRFSIYSLQLSILLTAIVGTPLTVSVLLASITTFLLVTIIPSFLLADLGIREAVALIVFSQIGINEFVIVASTFVIWLINLALPATIGALIISLRQK